MAWERRRLSSVITLEYGKPLPKESRASDGSYPAYGANGILCHTNKFYCDRPTIIVGRKGSAGEINLTEDKFWPTDVTFFIDFDRSKYDLRFLFHALGFLNLQKLARGVKPGINRNDVYEIEFAFPPLPEQRRIVAILDEAFAGLDLMRANAEKNLKNARELFKKTIEHAFDNESDGWAEVTFNSIAAIKGGKRVPKGYKLLTEKTAFPYVRVTDFTDSGTIDTSDLRYIDATVHEVIKRYVIRKEDLYISIAGTIGKTGIIPKELDGAHLTENACRLVFGSEVDNHFVYYFTKTRDFVRQTGLNTRTTAQPKLALSRLATVKLRMPPKADQLEWVVKFRMIETAASALEATYTQKIAAIATLKQSILQKAFSGELASTESIAA